MFKKILFLLIFISGYVFAGVTGKIAGTVTDKKTQEPLIGANVLIEGTVLGASTDTNGDYFINNIPPGTYTIKVLYIGYQTVLIEDVLVKVDLTTAQNIEMSEQVDVSEVIVVQAQRPLIQKDLSSSQSVVTSDEFDHTPLQTIQQVVQLTAGITVDNNGNMHVRGGRTGEVAYLVDGVSVMDPIRNTRGTNLNLNAVSEVTTMTGGFAAEYGEAMSGVVNMVTKEGGEKFGGSIRYTTDQGVSLLGNKWGEKYPAYPFADRSSLDFGYNRLETSLNGPIPGVDRLNFFLSNEVTLTDDRSPQRFMLPHHDQEYYSTQLKLTYLLEDPRIKFTLSGFDTRDQYGNFNSASRYWLSHYYSQSLFSKQLLLKINHTLSNKTFYDLNIGYFRTEGWTAVRDETNSSTYDHWWENYDYKRGAYPNISYNQYEQSFNDIYNPFGLNQPYVAVGDARIYEFRWTDTYNLKANLTSQVDKFNQLKSGFEVKQYHVRFFNNNLNYDPKPFQDDYNNRPFQGAVYLQDKLEHEGIVINAGLRFDYFDSKAYKYSNPYDNTSKKIYADPKYLLSPRIGISHPISNTAHIYYNYGKFFQTPQLRWFFTGINSDLTRGNQILGDPNLNVEKTTSYEIGYNQLLTENLSLNVKAFYKDIKDLVQTRLIPAVPSPYFLQENVDFANVRGFEISFRKRLSNYIGGSANYTLSVAKGTAANATDAYYNYYNNPDQNDPVTGGTRVLPRSDFYLDYDQRHTFNLSANVVIGNNEGPEMFSMMPLQNVSMNIVYQLASGLPYNRLNDKGQIVGTQNDGRLPWSSNLDLRLSKGFNVAENVQLNFFTTITNLFNTKTIDFVYGQTGRPDDDGKVHNFTGNDKTSSKYVPFVDVNNDGVISDAEAQTAADAAYKYYLDDPLNYGPPRIVRIGLELLF